MAYANRQALHFSTFEPDKALDTVRKIYCDAHWTLKPRDVPAAPITLFNQAFGHFSVSTVSYGRAIEIEPQTGDQTTMIIGVLKGQVGFSDAGASFQGGPGSIAVLSSLAKSRFAYSADAKTFKFILDRHRLDAFLARMTGLPAPRTRFELRMGSQAHCRLWASFFRTFQTMDASHGATAMHRQLEEMLMTALLQTQGGAHSALLEQAVPLIAPRHVKAVTDFVEQHLHQALCLDDLANVGRCSIRSLTRGFQLTYQCTPMQFVRHARLKRVRADLQNKQLSDTTVTQIAMANGFNHMGEFARSYRLAFGELPTETRH